MANNDVLERHDRYELGDVKETKRHGQQTIHAKNEKTTVRVGFVFQTVDSMIFEC
jgi:hypothetical protein